MSLPVETMLGPYEITAPIGAGGMGEVYKARDTRLDRTVAIKVLPEHLAESPERKARFEREAKAISQLNHPHICTLYDVGEQDGIDFIVMEYIEGETLAERLKKGRLKLDQALEYGIQIADGLDKAHRAGIIHRDLKPGNVMLTRSGVKLLDFGLARLIEDDCDSDTSDAPTRQQNLTQEEAIIGTLQYMAPEQLERKAADVRTDIFAFGDLLYEMLTGAKAFTGNSQASLISAIMTGKPDPIASHERMAPPALDHVLRRCLEKDPDKRWQSARDVKLELEWVREEPQIVDVVSSAPRTPSRERVAWMLALLAAVVVTGAAIERLSPAPEDLAIRTEINLPPGQELDDRQDSNPLAISPDGTRIVFSALGGGSVPRLFVRELDRFDVTSLPGTDDAINPFFSPDGQWVAFFANGKLLKVSVEGGAPIEITDAPFGSFGADWADDGSIVFDQAFASGGLMRVSADGGDADALTTVDGSASDIAHRQPEALPDGRGVLLHVDVANVRRPAVWRAGSDEVRLLPGIPTDATLMAYMPSGLLVYTHSGALWAVPFDLETLETTGAATIVLDGIYTNDLTEWVALSRTGTLAYAIREAEGGGLTLAWVDRRGQVSPITAEPGAYTAPVLSPDGSQLAVQVGDSVRAEVRVIDIVRGTRRRIGELGAATPAWTPDGRRITYVNAEGIYTLKADGSGEPELVVSRQSGLQFAGYWSTDGESLVYYEMHPSTGRDIWMVSIGGEPVPLVVTDASERSPRLSPNGRWVAYVSDESGRDEVYVQSVRGQGAKQVISTEGGREPVWSRDGTELFYRRGDELLVVDVDTGDELKAGTPRTLLTARFGVGGGGRNQNYDVSPNGERFVFIQRDEGVPRKLRVVLNWPEELKRLVPTDK